MSSSYNDKDKLFNITYHFKSTAIDLGSTNKHTLFLPRALRGDCGGSVKAAETVPKCLTARESFSSGGKKKDIVFHR